MFGTKLPDGKFKFSQKQILDSLTKISLRNY